jgi:hypothetical protein
MDNPARKAVIAELEIIFVEMALNVDREEREEYDRLRDFLLLLLGSDANSKMPNFVATAMSVWLILMTPSRRNKAMQDMLAHVHENVAVLTKSVQAAAKKDGVKL